MSSMSRFSGDVVVLGVGAGVHVGRRGVSGTERVGASGSDSLEVFQMLEQPKSFRHIILYRATHQTSAWATNGSERTYDQPKSFDDGQRCPRWDSD